MQQPIVLIGRGGSGTRLISQIVRDAGVFMGNNVNATGDSVEWVPTIYELLVDKLSSGTDLSDVFNVQSVEKLQDCGRAILKRAELNGIDASASWGWKLPETMLLLPEVARAFKDARIIHLVRHPVTCALRRSHMTSRRNNKVGNAVLNTAHSMYPRDPKTIVDIATWDNAVSWQLQVEAVSTVSKRDFSPERVLNLRYEDLSDDWPLVRRQLSAFLCLPQKAFKKPAFEANRRQAFELPDARIDMVWELSRRTAERYGYSLSATGRPINF